jgi:8-oxo-dGTP diphosphatase
MAHVPTIRGLEEQAIIDGIHQLVVGAVIEQRTEDTHPSATRRGLHGRHLGTPQRKGRDGETLDVALVREVEEETGLIVTEIREYRGSFDYISGSGKKSRQFNFNVQVSAVDPGGTSRA